MLAWVGSGAGLGQLVGIGFQIVQLVEIEPIKHVLVVLDAKDVDPSPSALGLCSIGRLSIGCSSMNSGSRSRMGRVGLPAE
jgi:hypothetical protein